LRCDTRYPDAGIVDRWPRSNEPAQRATAREQPNGSTDRTGAQQSRRKGESDAANEGARQEGRQIAQTQGSGS
jgi:hypothetical protein